MIHQVVAVLGHPERVARAVVWAKAPLRVAPAATSGWTWVVPDPEAPGNPPMAQVAREASAEGPAVLVTVAPQRSEVQVWQREERLVVVGVDAGRVLARDHDAAARLARDLCAVLPGADERAVTRLLRVPPGPATAWLDLVLALGVPVPSLVPGEEWTLGGGPDVVPVAARTLREAQRVSSRRQALGPVPDTEPEAWWWTALRLVAVALVGWLVVHRLGSEGPGYATLVAPVVGAAVLVPGLVTALRRRAARRAGERRRSPG